jgi:hypothetical protein
MEHAAALREAPDQHAAIASRFSESCGGNAGQTRLPLNLLDALRAFEDYAGCGAANRVRGRIAAPGMLPEAKPLPHLICSRPIFIGGVKNEADQHDDA